MPQPLPHLSMTYRSEVLQPLFHNLHTRESCAVAGCASMGKTRLVEFIMRPDVQQHYLGSDAASTLMLRADCNRLREHSEWGIYELLLTAIVEGCSAIAVTQPLRGELNSLRMPVLKKTNKPVLALRQLELAMRMICQEHNIQVRFLLDEFDGIYRSLPALSLDNLRALRDANKHHLSYVLFLRQPLARLREPAGNESFYELFSRALLGLTPYTPEDVGDMFAQVQARRQVELPAAQREIIHTLSGGHPGTIMALFDLALKQPELVQAGSILALAQDALIVEECRKLWHSLDSDERLSMLEIAQGSRPAAETSELLLLKGLAVNQDGKLKLFNPLIEAYARQADIEDKLTIHALARTVMLGGRKIPQQAPLVFDLLLYLYEHAGEVCDREQIIQALYHNNHADINDNALDNLVKRARQAIEPEPQKPRYLITCRGVGYTLHRAPLIES
ncbi:MAG TPA: winged helix-turn-helix domain-containing protein [Levilinea sp.]|nr:winged helix-turn-helix domain-containing protein [Levilinea sp.]